eukprot:TRINITY_DN4601_c0_g1_i2.p1 TRINITY_DN4601_c0_g1~~TRINITY_DN4601_c0_g1_i2.p1  ORF type:complete len:133 (+),score=22.95 TRINITY_DN4601_c0_g1_i2:213-611(+)
MANGQRIRNYLCEARIKVAGVEIPLVVAVGPDRNHLLGLDAMFSLDMVLKPADLQFTISSTPRESKIFPPLSFKALLHAYNLKEADLVPVESLPTPEEAERQQKERKDKEEQKKTDLGSTQRVVLIDMGMVC